MGLTRAEKAAPRHKDYDQERRHTYGRPYLYTTVTTKGSLRTIL
jgi:hypothetical protein